MTHTLETATFELLHQEFMRYTEQIGYTKGTRHYLRLAVQAFLWWCEQRNIYQLRELRTEDVLHYHRYLQERPSYQGGDLSEAAVYQNMYGVRLLLSYLQETMQIERNPMSGMMLKYPVIPRREPISQEEVHILYDSCLYLRDRAILALLYGCGLRSMEAVKVELEDVHLRHKLLYVRLGKGGRSRSVPMSEGVVRELRQYIHKERPLLLNKVRKERAVLLGIHDGRALKAKTLSARVSNLAEASMYEGFRGRRITAHVLRHSIATHLLERGMPVEQVQEFLGHKMVDTTQIYAHVSTQHLGATIRHTHNSTGIQP